MTLAAAPSPIPGNPSIGILGCGNLGSALASGLLAAGHPAERLHVSASDAQRAQRVAKQLGVVPQPDNQRLAAASDVLLLTVKPAKIEGLCQQIRDHLRSGSVVISCAAGVQIERCAAALNPEAQVGRAMPNVSAQVGEGCTALWLPPDLSGEQTATCEAIFEASGTTVLLEDEQLFDVATALVGSGPAFVCVFIEALADGAVQSGMPRALADSMAAATTRGAATLVERSGEHPAIWKDRVMSPGGTTAAGLVKLEQEGMRTAVMQAIAAATQRARELGGRG